MPLTVTCGSMKGSGHKEKGSMGRTGVFWSVVTISFNAPPPPLPPAAHADAAADGSPTADLAAPPGVETP